ncbi:DUF4254 domain-containing protein [bacterium]|jgi:hypothetical protein|nr:DUF4254 domain-containing protein [bacterium]
MNTNNTLPSSTELLQIFWTVINRWHDQEASLVDLDTAEEILAPTFNGWGLLVENLQLINTFQWHQEDKSRASADSVIQAEVKRAIDDSNNRRIEAIEDFDFSVMDALEDVGLPDFNAPLHSETPGLIIDRLTILALKIYHLRAELEETNGTIDEDVINIKLLSATEQFEDLTECFDRLFNDIAKGKASIKMYKQIKIYDNDLSD